jgi:hypothetical protein
MERAHEVLCPYCFQRWSTRVGAFRCLSSDEKRCPRVPDEAHGRLNGIDPPMSNKVLVKEGKMGLAFATKPGKAVRCDCGSPTFPVCPLCHSRLPQLFASAMSRSMALIGTKASGKSHFVAVVLHELDHRVGPQLNGSLMLLDDYTRDRVTNELLPRLYRNKIVLEATQSAATEVSTSSPLAARLTIGALKDASNCNLIFFDSAGEDLQSLSVLEREARYVTQSDGLILLIDPLQIPAIRDQLDGDIELPPISTDPKTMLDRVAALIRETRSIPADKAIDMPIALAVSKLDALRGLLPETHPALRARPTGPVFDRVDARNVSDTMRSDLVGWLGEGFDRFVHQNFSNLAFFGLSALGEPPVNGKLAHGVSPHRVEDPVLWLLDRWGALPTSG